MAYMEWNRKKNKWVKECTVCKYEFQVDGETWEEGLKLMRKFFSIANEVPDGMHLHCLECRAATKRGAFTTVRRQILLNQQKGLCAICKKSIEFNGNRFSACIDHNHKTMKVRGILCGPCNIGLSKFDENIGTLMNAISYLQKHGNKHSG